jgi:hypothetical protein
VLTGGGELATLQVAVQGNYLYGAPAAGNTLHQPALATERQRLALPQALAGLHCLATSADDSARERQDIARIHAGRSWQSQHQRAPARWPNAQIPHEAARQCSACSNRAAGPWCAPWSAAGGLPTRLVGVRPLFERDVAQEGSLAEFEAGARQHCRRQAGAAAQRRCRSRLVREDRQLVLAL